MAVCDKSVSIPQCPVEFIYQHSMAHSPFRFLSCKDYGRMEDRVSVLLYDCETRLPYGHDRLLQPQLHVTDLGA